MRAIRIRCAAGLAAQRTGGHAWLSQFTYGSFGAGMRQDIRRLSDIVGQTGCQTDVGLRSERQQALFFLIGDIE